MESRKRKRAGELKKDEERWRPSGSAREETVSEAEVEEFFAILRRMRDAANFLPARNNSVARHRWTPAFSLEDFSEGNIARQGVEEATREQQESVVQATVPESVADNGIARGLDLNTEPQPE